MPFEMTIKIYASPYVPEGRQVLRRDGKNIYIGRLGDPIEDAEFDEVVLSHADFEDLAKETS